MNDLYSDTHDDCPIDFPHHHPLTAHELAYGKEHDESCPLCGTDNVVLDEWSVHLFIRVRADGTSPDKWDFNTLLDLESGVGEQVWIEKTILVNTGTEKELEG